LFVSAVPKNLKEFLESQKVPQPFISDLLELIPDLEKSGNLNFLSLNNYVLKFSNWTYSEVPSDCFILLYILCRMKFLFFLISVLKEIFLLTS
jgi:hypothetical protein